MLVSLEWLKDFVKLPKDVNPEELANTLTLKTAEVESVINEAKNFDKMVVGHVLELKPHPNADKLKLAKVSTGKETYQVVCGGENLREDMYVAFAKVGARVKWHGEGELVELASAKIRGIESFGMICASNEIGIDNPSEGPRDIADLSSLKPKIGMSLAEVFGKNDVVFEFDNKALTNRPDLWGHYGIALEVAAVTGGKFVSMHPDLKIPTKGESIKVEVKDPELCLRYCGLIIENIKVEESPEWMKKRLRATGHGCHNNIVDVTNYVMTELGQPMHAFDKNYIKGGIVVRTAKKGEKIKSLDDKERPLSEEMLVIADHEKAVAVAGIIGGENSEINEKTTAIILESANFHAGNARRTSSKLGVRTDSLQRFEKSLDPHLAELAMKRAAELILRICPSAKIAGPMTDIKNFDEKKLVVEFDVKKAQSKIGVGIKPAEMKRIFNALMFEVKQGGKDKFEITVPTWRSSKDVNIEDDLIEEIARMYGYENIPATLPELPTKLPIENTERFKKHRLRELLSYGLGFDEVYNYSFYGKSDLKKSLISEKGHVLLENYLSEDQTHLRVSLIPNLLKNLEFNTKYFEEVKIYEIGRSYKEIGEYYPLEEKIVAGFVCKKGKDDKVFFEAKGVVEAVLSKFNVKHSSVVRGANSISYAHPVKAATYLAQNGATLAQIFILHPQVARNYDLEKFSVAGFDINFTELLKQESEQKMYKQIPKFPGIDIDVSVLIDKTVEAEKIRQAILDADKDLIKGVRLFDIYEGQSLEQGKKALAFRISLLALDRTLTDNDMTRVQGKIFRELEKLGGKIRGKEQNCP